MSIQAGITATKTVYKLIGETKYLVDNYLDKYAFKFKEKNADFYNQYLSISRVLAKGVRHEKTEEPVEEQSAYRIVLRRPCLPESVAQH